jgi:pimeloyl-ACP methyl ester carboxylesterase
MSIELIPLCALQVQLKPPIEVGAGCAGTRLIIEVASIQAKGDRLRAEMMGASVADWLLIGPDGTGTLDVRATLRTGDGAITDSGVGDAYIKQSVYPSCMADGLPAAQAHVLAATQRPIATSALTQKSGVPAWKTIPSWAVVGTADHAIPSALQLAMANRAHAHITRVDASHLSMISDPGTVANVILRAVRATS